VQCLFKRRTRVVNCKFAEFAAMLCYIPETVQASAKVTTECEYELVCCLFNGVISNDKITVLFKGE